MNGADALPPGRLVAFYGDDFTGSSAVMEVLTFAGLPTVLFLDVPTPERLAPFADRPAIGIAGVARAKSPVWMDEHLPRAFAALAAERAALTHYKVCSTFDSAPHLGSIGRAIDLAVPHLGGAWHPLLVAAPAIHRYQLFANLFATVDGTGYRLDRHPTMARHPTTPMDEADVRLHLAKQTARPIGLVDLLDLRGDADAALRREWERGAEIVALDVIDEAGLAAAGRLIWEHRGDRLFTVGSQGVEYALVAHWRDRGWLGPPPPAKRAAPERVAAVSGSCSPVTARQIDVAATHGFTPIRLEAATAVALDSWERALAATIDTARRVFDDGSQPLVFTAQGPDDPAIAAVRAAARTTGMDVAAINERIGRGLGRVLRTLVREAGIRRVAIAGGDSSGFALEELGVHALEAEAELAPACALSRAHAEDAAVDGLLVALKGGQMGPNDYFSRVAHGRPIGEERG
ncbi:MAG: four-carbon acid sugar kinase family protein [Pseudomonadota bacterium]